MRYFYPLILRYVFVEMPILLGLLAHVVTSHTSVDPMMYYQEPYNMLLHVSVAQLYENFVIMKRYE